MQHPAFDIETQCSGRYFGTIWVPDARNDSADGRAATPIAILRNGVGPTVLLMAGVHGDEYAGQLALTRLLHEIDIHSINGRLIVLPAANIYAALLTEKT